MNRFKQRISGWNFKKIAVRFIVVTLLAAIACAAVTGYIFRDRITLAWQYAAMNRAVEQGNADSIRTQMDKLAGNSGIVDVLLLDNDNNVLYAAKKSDFGNGQFNLTKVGTAKNYLVSARNDTTMFKYIKSDDFMMKSVFNWDFGDVRKEFEEEYFYENDYANRTIYMLSYLENKNSAEKVYIISNPVAVAGGTAVLKADACIAVLFFMAYWVLLALWAYQNAAKAKLYPMLWGLIVLFTNLAGVLIYLLYKRGNETCPHCGASQAKGHNFCSFCGEKLHKGCPVCGAAVLKTDSYCHSCGEKLN